MCWSFEISLLSAIYGWIVCIYLKYRGRKYDDFYANYLFTFTFTQLIDLSLWYLNNNGGLQSCNEYQFQFIDYPKNEQFYNYIISKFALPLVVFSQHLVQCTYPSNMISYRNGRRNLILLHLIPVFIMSFCFSCTILYPGYFPIKSKTLLWGGLLNSSYIINQFCALLHSGIVSFVFYILMKNEKNIMYAHIIPLYIVILFLFITEGTITLGSKWCWYCLVYSFVYIFESKWNPKEIIYSGKKQHLYSKKITPLKF